MPNPHTFTGDPKVVIERIGNNTLCRFNGQTYFFGITVKAFR